MKNKENSESVLITKQWIGKNTISNDHIHKAKINDVKVCVLLLFQCNRMHRQFVEYTQLIKEYFYTIKV